jgi:hypothetical protein
MALPRWFWALVLLALAGLLWLGRNSSTPTALRSDGGTATCLPPPLYRDAAQPRQSPVPANMAPFRFGDALVTPLAGFSLQARVLSRADYWLGREADYSPTDLALGWGPMAAPSIEDRLDISQSGRWYHYAWGADGPPLPLPQIIGNSANMHMVPADASVAAALDRVRHGDTVAVNGWLIRIDRPDGWYWQSSLRRDDSGEGACELVLVCSIERR